MPRVRRDNFISLTFITDNCKIFMGGLQHNRQWYSSSLCITQGTEYRHLGLVHTTPEQLPTENAFR